MAPVIKKKKKKAYIFKIDFRSWTQKKLNMTPQYNS